VPSAIEDLRKVALIPLVTLQLLQVKFEREKCLIEKENRGRIEKEEDEVLLIQA
jgi:hypothetical protein